MRSLPFALLIVFAVAVPAGAQIVGKPPREYLPPPKPFVSDSHLPGPGVGRDLRKIRGQVERGRRSGTIARPEARRLKREARHIGALAHLYRRDGLSASERMELEARASLLKAAVNRPRPQTPAPGGKR